MNPTADARTGRKAYADCRRDCRNTGINIQRGLRKVNTRALLPAPGCGNFGVDFVECHFGGTNLFGIGGKLLHGPEHTALSLPTQFQKGIPSSIIFLVLFF